MIKNSPTSLHVPKGFPIYEGKRIGVELNIATQQGKVHLWVDTLVLEEDSNKPVLLGIHGQGEHSGRYQHLPHYLKGHYSRMVFFDLPGHGRSSGTRGHVQSFEVFYETVTAVYEYLLRFNPKAIHLFGHSLGGLIALGFLQNRPESSFEKAFISAPALGLAMPVPLAKRTLGLLMNQIWGSLQVESGLNAEHVSRDPEVVRAYLDDPLNHAKVTPRFFESFVQEMHTVKTSASRIREDLPMTLFVPGDDRICSRTEMLAFAGTRPLETYVYEYPGFYHEVLNDSAKEDVFADWQKNLQSQK